MRWGLIKLDLNTPNLKELRIKFKELHPKYKHLGVDDRIGIGGDCNKFSKQRLKEGKEYLQHPYIPQLREYAKFGCPTGLRGKIWNAMIITNEEYEGKDKEKQCEYFDYLLDKVDDIDMMTDCLYRLDVDQTTDHPDFFPFDDFLNDIMLAFS